MIIRITNKCRMLCKHCMINGVSFDGDHMARDVFERSMSFAFYLGVPIVVITGGEPTEHPLFFELMNFAIKKAKRRDVTLLITSNGMFHENERKKQRIIDLGVRVQVTNDIRYYPIRMNEKLFDNDIFFFVDKLTMVTPCKRTNEHNIHCNRIAPNCFNMRSLVRCYGLIAGMKMLSKAYKFCVPSVNIDGSVRAGEMDTCYEVATVYNYRDVIEKEIMNMKCNRCGLMDNLSRQFRSQVGE